MQNCIFRYIYILLFFVTSSNIFAQNGYVLEKLGTDINSPYDEITPVVDWDGKTVYFTRVGSPDFNHNLLIDNRDQSKALPTPQYNALLQDIYSKIAGHTVQDPVSSAYNQDIWIASCGKGEFDKIIHPNAPLNNALPNSISSMTPYPGTFVIINQFIPGGGMDVGFSIVKQESDTSWSFPKPLTIENYYTKAADISMTVSSDGRVMILSLDRNDTQGVHDLYVSFQLNDSLWSAPQNIGGRINTKWKETTPHLSSDLKKLYFASNRPESAGGTDIFYAERLDDTWTNWSEPRRFLAPINSAADESQPYFNAATGEFYFTSRRDNSSDIFRVKIAPASSEMITISGRVLNSKTGEPIAADILYGDHRMENFEFLTISKDGEFEINIPKGATYKFVPQREGFLGHKAVLSLNKYKYYTNGVELNLYLDPIEKDSKISLNPIYFQMSESAILEKSFSEIDYLTDVMKEFPTMYIVIEGHTDNQGKADELLRLSEQRTEAIKAALVKKGVERERIETTGFGGRFPIIKDPQSEDDRAKNRRVEVRITKVQ
jgi:outer membrane protein OmpA-like peptidoglycan-associated protein